MSQLILTQYYEEGISRLILQVRKRDLEDAAD